MHLKTRRLLYIVASSMSVVLVFAMLGRAQTHIYMTDPIFGISYDVRKVAFERAPAFLGQACAADLRGRKDFWVYANWKEGDVQYFVISSPRSQESGAAAVIHNGACTLGLPEWVLTGQARFNPDNKDTSITFSATALHGLVVDLLRRYTAAFGGKRSFLEAVRKHGIAPDDKIPVLKEEFVRFSRSPD